MSVKARTGLPMAHPDIPEPPESWRSVIVGTVALIALIAAFAALVLLFAAGTDTLPR